VRLPLSKQLLLIDTDARGEVIGHDAPFCRVDYDSVNITAVVDGAAQTTAVQFPIERCFSYLKKAHSIWCKAAPAYLYDLAMFPSILLKSFVAQRR
jgi:hypothetical protein